MKSMLEPNDRRELLERIAKLTPQSPRKFGTMAAPQMVAHLTDQMTHTLGDVPVTPHGGILQFAPLRWLVIYVLPWPKGSLKGPREAFVTKPTDWTADVARLCGLVERFGTTPEPNRIPPHALFGKMTHKTWGVFCYKHFNHHLEQFGV